MTLAAGVAACGGDAAPGDKGDDCFRAQDCREGLVCIELLCSDQVGKLVNTLPPPAAPEPP
jgi:hypothetical protein